MRKIRVSWEYPDIYTRPDDPYMHEDFEVDDDATPEEIQNEAEDIAFEHFSWSFWDVTKEHEMTEMLNQNTDKKSFLEKRIHEQAIEQFYQESFQALSSLSNSILGKMNVKNVSGYDYYDSLAQAMADSDMEYPGNRNEKLDAYLGAIFKNYEEFKTKEIQEIEKRKTDQISDEIGGLTELLRNNGDIPF